MKRKSPAIVQTDISTETYGTREYEHKFYSLFIKYNETTTNNECKKYFLTYVKTNNKNIEDYDFLPSKKYNPCGVYVKMELDGIKLPVSAKKDLTDFVSELEALSRSKTVKREQHKQEKHSKDVIHVQNFLGDLDVFMDSQLTLISKGKKAIADIAEILKKYNFHPKYHEETKIILSKIISDIKGAKTKKDVQLVEGYSYLSTKQLTKYLEFLNGVYSTIDKINTQPPVSVTRKVRVKKPEQLVKKVNIQPQCVTSGLKSCPKIDIIGSNTIYVYITRTRTLVQYKSTSGASIKGCTLLNISSSVKKKIRNPHKTFLNVNPKNFVFMKKIWESIKTKEALAKTRISPYCVLVSCFKHI